VIHRDGHRSEIEINAGQMIYQGQPASLAIVRDVTERKRFERYLRESEQRYRCLNEDLKRRVAELSTLNSIAQAVANITDLEEILNVIVKDVTLLFDACGAAVGLLNEERTAQTLVAVHTTKEALRASIGMRLPLEDDTPACQALDSGHAVIIADAQQNPVTEANRTLAEHYGIQSLMTVPLWTRGQSIGTFTLLTDQVGRSFTTEEARLAETIAGQVAGVINSARLFDDMREARAKAEAANRAKSVFLANMSHDLRTPLNAMMGFSRLMMQAPNITPEQHENLTTIHESGEHLLGLINAILALATDEVTSHAGQPLDAPLGSVMYEKRVPPGQTAPPTTTSVPEMTLPETWIDSMSRATVEGDVGHIYQLIEELRAEHPNAAQQLEALIDNFDYASIHDLIQRWQGTG
jgi:signal transduction histidine kinase